jgi:hypothetical protein
MQCRARLRRHGSILCSRVAIADRPLLGAKDPAGKNLPSTRCVYLLTFTFRSRATCQRKLSDGWSFVVTLSKLNKSTSQKESVRLEPHPPRLSPTALEARHWGATYALYRVRTSMLYVAMTGSRDLNLYSGIVLQWHTAQSCSSARPSRLLE